MVNDTNSNENKPELKKERPPRKNRFRFYGVFLLILMMVASASVWWGIAQNRNSQVQLVKLRADLQAQKLSLASLKKTQANQQQKNHSNQKISKKLLQKIRANAMQIGRISRMDPTAWRLAEVEYLIRQASQTLLTQGNVKDAISMLVSADSIVYDMDNLDLIPLRKAMQEDLAELRASGSLDYTGIYLQISALEQQVVQLPDFTRESQVRLRQKEPLLDTQELSLKDKALGYFYRAWSSFGSLFYIDTNRKSPVKMLLTPRQQVYLRQNLYLLLTQAQSALLYKEPSIYQQALGKTKKLLQQYFPYQDPKVKALIKQISQLEKLDVKPVLPSLNDSLKAIKAYLDQQKELTNFSLDKSVKSKSADHSVVEKKSSSSQGYKAKTHPYQSSVKRKPKRLNPDLVPVTKKVISASSDNQDEKVSK